MIRETSTAAYDTIKANGLLSRARFDVYQYLFVNGPLTRSEIDEGIRFVGKGGIKSYKSHVSARLCELREMGCVKEVGEKKCSITGMHVILWDVTKDLPRKFKRKSVQTRLEIALDALGRISEEGDLITSSIAKDALNKIRNYKWKENRSDMRL